MKIDLFENKYKTSNALKIFFFDIVCFLLFAAISMGVCYAYFTDNANVKGDLNMGQVTVEYRAKVDSNYELVDYVHAIINGDDDSTEDDAVSLNEIMVTPGDSIKIVGRAVNTSNVPVFVLARLNIEVLEAGASSSTIRTIWFNIGTNDPAEGEPDTPTLGDEEEPRILTVDQNGMYQIGASTLGANKYKVLKIPYTFSGDEYQNGDEIKSLTLTLKVCQKNFLGTEEELDSGKYNDVTTDSITYTKESIYAAHYITDSLLTD